MFSFNQGMDQINAASDAIMAGNVKEARLILREVLNLDKHNLAAWELLYKASYNDQERDICLKRILLLEPNHAWARQKLHDLKTTAQETDVVFTASGSNPSSSSPQRNKKRNRSLVPILGVIIGVFSIFCIAMGLVVFFNTRGQSANLTRTEVAANFARCQMLIDQALVASGDSCGKVGSNQACYGNNTVRAKLVPGASKPFDKRGDILEINQIERISAAPLDTTINEWGIAIIKVMANLPRSLPGETITLVVFGNTQITNANNLETFYFSSELGRVVCDQVPFDGLMITMPEGTGMHFNVNGSEITLMGNASLKAARNGNMEVDLYSGAGSIESDGENQIFTAGEKVTVPLGGESGTDSIGPPSDPQPLSPNELTAACTMTGSFCDPAEIIPIDAGAAQLTLVSINLPTHTPEPSITASPSIPQTTIQTSTSTITITGTTSPAAMSTLGPIVTQTPPSGTITRTRTVTPTYTNTPLHTPTITFTASLTHTPTASGTNTPTSSSTPMTTLTETPAGPVACVPSQIFFHSPISFNSDKLEVDIKNSFGSNITISKLHFDWQDAGPTQLDYVRLDETHIWGSNGDGHDNSPPSDFASSGSEFDWHSSNSDRRIDSGNTDTLLFAFSPSGDLPDGLYALRVTFGGSANCYIDISGTK
jgi:hypothetical protein